MWNQEDKTRIKDMETAKRILHLSEASRRIIEEQFEIQKELNMYSWDQVQSEAMRFLMNEQNKNVAR